MSSAGLKSTRNIWGPSANNNNNESGLTLESKTCSLKS